MDFKTTLKNAAHVAKEKADKAVDTGKIALELRRAKADLAAGKRELADRVFEKYMLGQLEDEGLKDVCDRVEQAKKQAATLQKALSDVKKDTVQKIRSIDLAAPFRKKQDDELCCPECGNKLKDEYLYCPICGAHIETIDDIILGAQEIPPEEAAETEKTYVENIDFLNTEKDEEDKT